MFALLNSLISQNLTYKQNQILMKRNEQNWMKVVTKGQNNIKDKFQVHVIQA